MKQKTKAIIVAVFFGGILLTSTVAIALPNILPSEDLNEEEFTKTGTPADNFPDSQRTQFCGTGAAKSNSFIKEFEIPTVCTQPLAISSDSEGNIWFAQTNTGNIAKFDPKTESFSEYKNPAWPQNGRSMMWGMDYSPDDSLWYTDENYDSIWKFTISDEKFTRLAYPSSEDSLPQKIRVIGSQVIVNDFTGNKITFLDPAQVGEEISYLSMPSPVENSLTSDFAIDLQNNLWYTNWIFQKDGILVKFDQDGYQQSVIETNDQALPMFEFIKIFKLPPGLTTPNGMTTTKDGRVWIADTSSSLFFSFDPDSETFSKYITSPPPLASYGNFSGLIKTPVSRPYWMKMDNQERIVFNEQTGNRIGIFDPRAETLIEYVIPSKNPNWADCAPASNCGLAQIFDFTIVDDKIWFSEWVENNIGVLDTSKQLPLQINLETKNLTIKKGESTTQVMKISAIHSDKAKIISSSTADFSDITVIPATPEVSLKQDEEIEIPISIKVSEDALSNTHKVLIGVQTGDVTISEFVTITIVS